MKCTCSTPREQGPLAIHCIYPACQGRQIMEFSASHGQLKVSSKLSAAGPVYYFAFLKTIQGYPQQLVLQDEERRADGSNEKIITDPAVTYHANEGKLELRFRDMGEKGMVGIAQLIEAASLQKETIIL